MAQHPMIRVWTSREKIIFKVQNPSEMYWQYNTFKFSIDIVCSRSKPNNKLDPVGSTVRYEVI